MAKDPICSMQVDEKQAAGKSEYEGKTYYSVLLVVNSASIKNLIAAQIDSATAGIQQRRHKRPRYRMRSYKSHGRRTYAAGAISKI